MSGKRQHFIPCYLQAGFAVPTYRWKAGIRERRPSREWQTWLSLRNGEVKRRSPEEWGFEEHFYELGEVKIDEGWAKWDQKDSNLVRKLREEGMNQQRAQLIPGFVTRLAERTAVARRAMARLIEEMAIEALDADGGRSAEAQKRRWIRRAEEGDPELLETMRREIERGSTVRKVTDKKVRTALKAKARLARRMTPEFFAERRAWALNEERPRMEVSAREAHLAQLARNAQQGRVRDEFANGMVFGAPTVSGSELCLGDNVVVLDRDGGEDRGYGPEEDRGRPLRGLYVPLGSRRLLVGLKKGTQERDGSWVLEAIARLSLEGFISRNVTPGTQWMQSVMGTWANRK